MTNFAPALDGRETHFALFTLTLAMILLTTALCFVYFAFSVAQGSSTWNWITVSWTGPTEPPKTQAQVFAAIERHALAFEAAQYLSKLFQINVKLCPDAAVDPLVQEFTVPRMIGFTKYYDLGCISSSAPEVKLNSADDADGTKTALAPPKVLKRVTEGLKYSALVWRLKRNGAKQDRSEVWVLDSNSIRAWFKGALLYSFNSPAMLSRSYAHLLLRQLNAMNGPAEDKNLKREPRAIQGALCIVLPSSYSQWNAGADGKVNPFDATWLKSGALPTPAQVKARISDLIKNNIDPLTMIVHDNSAEAVALVQELQAQFGDTKVIPIWQALPAKTVPLQLLKAIQMAGRVVVDDRDLLGRLVLLARGNDQQVERFHFGRSNVQKATMFISSGVVIAAVAYLIHWTRKYYEQAALKQHAIRYATTVVLAGFLVILINPTLWPKKFVYFWYGVFECGLGGLFYGLIAFYLMAALLTVVALLMERRSRRADEVYSPITPN